jgi:hypothetical protein
LLCVGQMSKHFPKFKKTTQYGESIYKNNIFQAHAMVAQIE